MRVIDTIIKISSILTIFGLLGSYTAPYINPNTCYFPSLLGLAYPYLLIATLLFLLYWVARWKKFALLLLGVLILGYPFLTTYYGFNRHTTHASSGNLEIMSYNVRQMDIYGWSKQKDTPQKLIQYINEYRGDIVCLQEFPRQESYALKLTAYPYRYHHEDVAIFSKFPIIKKGYISFNKQYTSSCIYCDIHFQTDTIRIYNVHLESYRLNDKDRKIFQEISAGNTPAISQSAHTILSHLITANKFRARQAEKIKKHMNDSPYPLILCGDFNDTPISYTYSTLDNDLTDSFIKKGRGIGNTYIGEFPSFRIDHILHSNNLKTISYHKERIRLSDHYPISAKINLH